MAIILVRHGETAFNAARVLQPADTPLSARGQAQAAALARRLAATPVAAILASDLPRAWATAQAIAASCAAPLRASVRLHERNFGALRGRPYDSLGFDPIASADAAEGGESMAAFRARADAAWDEVRAAARGLGGDLVVVTHGLVIRQLLGRAGAVPAATLPGLHLGNTSVSIVAADPPHALHLLNCTRHLDDDRADDRQALVGG
jgi:broad specificity phosphatase PhoE